MKGRKGPKQPLNPNGKLGKIFGKVVGGGVNHHSNHPNPAKGRARPAKAQVSMMNKGMIGQVGKPGVAAAIHAATHAASKKVVAKDKMLRYPPRKVMGESQALSYGPTAASTKTRK